MIAPRQVRLFALTITLLSVTSLPTSQARLAMGGGASTQQSASDLLDNELPAELPPDMSEFVRRHSFDDPEFRKRQVAAQGVRSFDAARSPEVRMIYLVPSDRSVRPEYIIAEQNAILHLQAFFREQMGNGTSFSVHSPVVEVYKSRHAANFFSTGVNAGAGGFWESVLGEVFSLTGGGFDDPNNRWIIYVDADPGCGQVTGGTHGVALLPANDFRGLTGQAHVPACAGDFPDRSGVCRWVGGLGHELGHAYNLPHPPGCDQNDATLCGSIPRLSLMYLGYTVFPNTHLLDQDRASLAGTGFLLPFGLATPGSSFCASMLTQTPNPIDDSAYFVRWQYKDFLNREPDDAGAAFWTNEIESCGTDAQCREVKRINVSAAFFLSIEFQNTGYLVYRMHKAAFGNLPNKPVPVTRSAFLADTQAMASTPAQVVVGQPGWEQQLETNKQAFANAFVRRAQFTSAYPTTRTPAQFVDELFSHAGITPSATDRQTAIDEFGGAANTADTSARARALRDVAENAAFVRAEVNRAFVLMQYFGYLQRDPDSAPDADFSGYDFWLTKLDQFNGNFVDAEMVKAFIQSIEYRGRFGKP